MRSIYDPTTNEDERPLLQQNYTVDEVDFEDSMGAIEENEVDVDTVAIAKESSAAHRRFLLRLDICLLSWAWCAYLFKQVDSSNYKTAYASGMKEDLSLYGNELNFMNTYFRVGYALFVIPSQLLMTRLRPSYYLPVLEIIWGVLTALMALAQDTKLIYGLRFFIGVAEASSYPGIISILCNWYTSEELATRVAIFGTSYPAASIFVGFMQAALHKGMDGAHGLAGWRWLFIFNGIMTVFFACVGFVMIPDSPASTRAFWLNASHRAIAKKRMDDVGRRVELSGVNREILKKAFTTWPLYLFTIAFSLYNWSQIAGIWIQLFLMEELKPDGTLRFSVEEINLIPIGGYITMIVFMVFFTWASDKTGHRARFIILEQGVVVICCIILAVWPKSFAFKLVVFFILHACYSAGHILIAWMTDICRSSAEWRMINIGVAVTFSIAIDAWQNIFIYPASEAPIYPRLGYKVSAAYAAACCIIVLVMKYLYDGNLKLKLRNNRKSEEA